MIQIRTVIADALRIDEEVNGFLKYCANYEKIVKKITPSGNFIDWGSDRYFPICRNKYFFCCDHDDE